MLNEFKLVVDLKNPLHFYHTNRLREEDSAKRDGLECIERIKSSNDLVMVYINGTGFELPIKGAYKQSSLYPEEKIYFNEWSEVSETTDEDGGDYLTIDVRVRPEHSCSNTLIDEHGELCS